VKENRKARIGTPPEKKSVPANRKDKEWGSLRSDGVIARDLMIGNPKLAGHRLAKEEARGYNALAGGFQGQSGNGHHFPERRLSRSDSHVVA